MSKNQFLFVIPVKAHWIDPGAVLVASLGFLPLALLFFPFPPYSNLDLIASICPPLPYVLILTLSIALLLHEALHWCLLKLSCPCWRRLHASFRALPVELKADTWWLPGIPTRAYSDMLMPTGIRLTTAIVLPSSLLAFITTLVALTFGCDWRISSITFFIQLGFGLNDFRVACFTVRPGRWYLDNGDQPLQFFGYVCTQLGEKTFSPSSPKRLSFLFLLGAPRFA